MAGHSVGRASGKPKTRNSVQYRTKRGKMNDRDEKIIQFAQKDAARLHQPNCPKCKHEPLEFMCNVVKTPVGHLVSIIWCGHCGYTLSAQFVGMDQPQQPMIVRPS